jgi:hypothetical protein
VILGEALRLFPGYAAADLEAPDARPFLLSRLLEDGDSADLRRLFAAVPEISEVSEISEAGAAAWLATHGGRQLSIRSRAFWELVLGTPAGPAAPGIAALWPL